MDKCSKHDECITDIREDIHEQNLTVSKLEGMLEGFMKSTQDYIDASRSDMYSKEGLIDRVGNHANQIALQWGLISLVVVAIIGVFFAK